MNSRLKDFPFIFYPYGMMAAVTGIKPIALLIPLEEKMRPMFMRICIEKRVIMLMPAIGICGHRKKGLL